MFTQTNVNSDYIEVCIIFSKLLDLKIITGTFFFFLNGANILLFEVCLLSKELTWNKKYFYIVV